MIQGKCYIYYQCCFILCEHCITPVEIYHFISYYRPVPTWKHVSWAEYFYQVAYTSWQSVGELFLPVVCVSPRYEDSESDEHPAISIQLFHLLYHIFCICQSLPLLSSASDNFCFWQPCHRRRLQNLPSQDRQSLWKAILGRILCPCDFPIEGLGIFYIRILFSSVQIFLCYCYIIFHTLII